MTVKITSYVAAQAGGNDKIYLSVPSGFGSISITDVIGLQGALDSKLNDTLSVVGMTNVTATGADLNSITGLSGIGVGTTEFQWLFDTVATGVTPTEMGYSIGLTSNVQAQLDTKYDQNDFTTNWEIIVGTGAMTAAITPFILALNAHAVSDLGTALANVNMGGFGIVNLLDPVNPQDAATRSWVLTQIGAAGGPFLPLDGTAAMTGDIDMGTNDVTNVGNVDGRDVSADGSTLDTHVGDLTLHRVINDAGTSTTELWSADKISTELAGKANAGHTHTWLSLTDTVGSFGSAGDVVVVNGSANGLEFATQASLNAVTSVFTRTGAVVAQNGDYTASNITNIPAGNIAAVTVQAALNELDSEKADASSLATVATSGDYNDLINQPTIVANWTDLGDTPGSYTAPGDVVVVNGSSNGLVFAAAASITPVASVFGRTGAVVAAASDYTAAEVDYVNGASGLTATDVQAAIDEVEGRVDTLEGAGPFLPLAGGTMAGNIDMGGNDIVNIGNFAPGNHVFNLNDYQSAEGGQSFFIRTSATPGAATPTYSFLNEQTTGWYHDSINMKATRQGTDMLELGAGVVDVKTNRVVNAGDPVNDQDVVTKAFLEAQTPNKVLGVKKTIDLVGGSVLHQIHAVPTGKTHIFTHVIVRARTYNPTGLTTNPVISVGTNNPNYDDIVDTETLDWGVGGAADQAVYALPKQGAATPNAAAQIWMRVNTQSDQAALVVDVYLVGLEIDV